MRRFLRFGLGTLFVVLTIVCMGLGVLTSRVRRQQRAVAAILKAGGRVRYEHATVIGLRNYPDKNGQRGRWAQWLGDDWFYAVRGVTLYGEGCNDANVLLLKVLPEVRNLALWAWAEPPSDGPTGGTSTPGPLAGITDEGFKVVARLPKLEQLSMMGNRVSDVGLGYLSGNSHLKDLQISPDSSNATAAGIRAVGEGKPAIVVRP